MGEIIFWSVEIIVGSLVYLMLKGEDTTLAELRESRRVNKIIKECEKEERIYNKTYDYFKNLSYEEQEKYIKENHKLSEYEGNIRRNCSLNDKHQTAKYVADIAVREGRPFNNINSSK